MRILYLRKFCTAAMCVVTTFLFGAESLINAQTSSGVSDANIVAIVTVADGLDIDYGRIALAKSKNKMVREFARQMVTDHTAVQKAVNDLAAKLSLTPAENDTSRGLAENGVKVKEKLNSLSGKEFDKYYIDNEVAYHTLVVGATSDVLIANAKNAELKTALVNTLPLFQRHLEHCQMIQKAFNDGTSMDDGAMMEMPAKISDANIGAIVLVADDLDIAYGQIALKKSKNKMVREFAQRMVKDHTAVQNDVKVLAGKLNLTPEENDTSRGLATGGVDVKSKLNSLEGKEFDKYYIDNEVAYHATVVYVTKNVLIPGATNPELKAALEQALPLFTRHLEHAKMIQMTFNKGKSKSSYSMDH